MRKQRKNDDALPVCIKEWGWKYHHVGIPTSEVKENEVYIERAKAYVSGFSACPCGVEWLRWLAGSPLPSLVKTIPHLSFVVKDIEWELGNRDFNILVPLYSPADGLRTAMIELSGIPIELLQFD